MWKVLESLSSLGSCSVLSARRRPVGMGWTAEACETFRACGFELAFREDDEKPRFRPARHLSMIYAILSKAAGLEKAFGHSNPYHRHAFDLEWLVRHGLSADLLVINYSYWSRVAARCPAAVILHDLLSDYMWEGWRREVEELKDARLVVVISRQEQERLHSRGITRTLWSPPVVEAMIVPDSNRIGIVGSANPSNREGLRWLARARFDAPVYVYGALSKFTRCPGFIARGFYEALDTPYKECGVILLPTSMGTGVQIKAVEALAAGRAIVARRGAFRGLPPSSGAWLEVDTPGAMADAAAKLVRDASARHDLMAAARSYYHEHLESEHLRRDLKQALQRAADSAIHH
jgi:glycosyltransferase involved in cell wall biosynthesis